MVVTNGIRFASEAFLRRAQDSGLEEIVFSVKGATAREYIESTGADAFKRVRRAIANIATSQMRHRISVTVSASVVDNWDDWIQFLTGIEIQEVNFSFEKPVILSSGVTFMPEVKIHWNTEPQELERVLRYFSEMDFYQKNNYHLSLPKNVGADSREEDVAKQVSAEYHPEKFEKKLHKIISDWKQIETDFFQNAQKILQTGALQEYECLVTQYGTGGSYNPPNQIIMNIRSKLFGFYAIAHELIHLLIHDLIEQYNVDHWHKERLVDLYFSKILHVDRYQKIPDSIDTKTVDAAFETCSSQGARRVILELQSL